MDGEEEEQEQLSPQVTQTQRAENDLEKECENTWVQINQVHERVNSGSPTGVLGDDQAPMLSVFQAKSKHLQGELHTLDSKQPQVLPTNPTILKALLHKELSTTNKELEQTLQLVQAQRKELEEELEREKGLLEEHKEVKSTLGSKLEDAAEDDTGSSSVSRSSQEKELQRQRKSAAEHQQKLMRNLAAFVSEHFPKPTEKPKETDKGERAKEYMSLLEILEILMNKCTDSESDPYVTVDDASWPPYIELLLRCGLALRHPQDCKRIRLVPFHL